MIPTRFQLTPVPFTEEYCSDLLGGVTVIHGKGYVIDEIRLQDELSYIGKKSQLKGKWKSPPFLTVSGITARLAKCASGCVPEIGNSK
jgi:hypothetical protein